MKKIISITLAIILLFGAVVTYSCSSCNKAPATKSTEEIYQTLTAENRRKFWRSFVDHIVVHSRDNMEIYFLRKDTY